MRCKMLPIKAWWIFVMFGCVWFPCRADGNNDEFRSLIEELLKVTGSSQQESTSGFATGENLEKQNIAERQSNSLYRGQNMNDLKGSAKDFRQYQQLCAQNWETYQKDNINDKLTTKAPLADISDYPWFGTLKVNAKGIGAAVLIANNLVLTAKHCLGDLVTRRDRYTWFSWTINRSCLCPHDSLRKFYVKFDRTTYRVKKIATVPDSDLAVLKIEGTVDLPPACFTNTPLYNNDQYTCKGVGRGTSTDRLGKLRALEVHMDQCDPGKDHELDHKLCTLQISCGGDSGSAVICKKRNNPNVQYIQGIFSTRTGFGSDCGGDGQTFLTDITLSAQNFDAIKAYNIMKNGDCRDSNCRDDFRVSDYFEDGNSTR